MQPLTSKYTWSVGRKVSLVLWNVKLKWGTLCSNLAINGTRYWISVAPPFIDNPILIIWSFLFFCRLCFLFNFGQSRCHTFNSQLVDTIDQVYLFWWKKVSFLICFRKSFTLRLRPCRFSLLHLPVYNTQRNKNRTSNSGSFAVCLLLLPQLHSVFFFFFFFTDESSA